MGEASGRDAPQRGHGTDRPAATDTTEAAVAEQARENQPLMDSGGLLGQPAEATPPPPPPPQANTSGAAAVGQHDIKRIVVIGGGVAGFGAVEKLIATDGFGSAFAVTVIQPCVATFICCCASLARSRRRSRCWFRAFRRLLQTHTSICCACSRRHLRCWFRAFRADTHEFSHATTDRREPTRSPVLTLRARADLQAPLF